MQISETVLILSPDVQIGAIKGEYALLHMKVVSASASWGLPAKIAHRVCVNLTYVQK